MGVEYGAKNLYSAYGVPALDLTFAGKKSLVDRISGQNLITFSRNSIGTYVGSDGLIKTASANEARFDHDPVTGESLGLLVEESSTNLLTNSENFSTWTYASATAITRFSLTQNISDIRSPDGLFTSDLITETTNSGPGYFIKTLPISANSYYCISFYVYGFGKYSSSDSSRRLIFGLFETSSATAVEGHTVAFNLGATSVTSSRLGKPSWAGGTGISSVFTDTKASIISVGNGWKRVSVCGTCSVSNPLIILTTLDRELGDGDNDGGAPFSMAGDGFSGISIWGVQGETLYFPTSYIPTTTTAVTRYADDASITGTNFSRWYNQNESTFIANLKFGSIGYYSYADAIGLSPSGAALMADNANLGIVSDIWGDTTYSGGPDPSSQFIKVARSVNFSNNSSILLSSGGNAVTQSPPLTQFTANGIRFGTRGDGSFYPNTILWLKRVIYYPKQLTNTQLQELTS